MNVASATFKNGTHKKTFKIFINENIYDNIYNYSRKTKATFFFLGLLHKRYFNYVTFISLSYILYKTVINWQRRKSLNNFKNRFKKRKFSYGPARIWKNNFQ